MGNMAGRNLAILCKVKLKFPTQILRNSICDFSLAKWRKFVQKTTLVHDNSTALNSRGSHTVILFTAAIVEAILSTLLCMFQASARDLRHTLSREGISKAPFWGIERRWLFT